MVISLRILPARLGLFLLESFQRENSFQSVLDPFGALKAVYAIVLDLEKGVGVGHCL